MLRFLRIIYTKIKDLRLADKFLLIFMIILLWQSAHSLFLHELSYGNSSDIDVVIRTTAAAIFGYFISGSFLHADKEDIAENSNTLQTVEKGRGTSNNNNIPLLEKRVKQQIIIVSGIGILSLIILISAMNTNDICPEAVATLSQFRDFVSGSVGLLIGQTSREKYK